MTPAPIERHAVFGHLTVLNRLNRPSRRAYRYLCGCRCGKVVKVNGGKLRKGEVTSCGRGLPKCK